MPQAEVTARSLRLQWVPGSDGASPIRYFTVQVRELPAGQWQTYSSSVSHEATACVVERYWQPGNRAAGPLRGGWGGRWCREEGPAAAVSAGETSAVCASVPVSRADGSPPGVTS